MKKIIIKKSQNADTRTCDWTKVSKQELLKNSKQHVGDVRKGLNYLKDLLREAGKNHDFTKLTLIDDFHSDFKTGFKRTYWWRKHQQMERHHFNTKKYIQKDVNLIDVLEQITDGVMAGMARSGKYRKEVPDAKLLLKAYENTAKLLLDKIEII
jgi:hydrogenase maturation factor HypF (carbamoyltransferase family)